MSSKILFFGIIFLPSGMLNEFFTTGWNVFCYQNVEIAFQFSMNLPASKFVMSSGTYRKYIISVVSLETYIVPRWNFVK